MHTGYLLQTGMDMVLVYSPSQHFVKKTRPFAGSN